MNKLRPLKTYSDLTTLSLNDQKKLRLNQINKIKYYFEFEIKEREAVIKKLSKYDSALDYTEKTLIFLSATSGGISIISFTNVIGIPEGVISASLTLVLSLTTGIIKKQLKETRKKKQKHSKIIMFAKSKLNTIETLMSQVLIDLDISHEEFKTIVNENEKYDQMKESIRNKNKKKVLVKMHKLTQKYANARVHAITVENQKLFWVKMIDGQKGLSLKNMPDLVKKEI